MSNPQPADPRLAAYPRPDEDNGQGIHFGLDNREPALEKYFPLLKQMKMKWAVCYSTAPDQTYLFCVAAKAAGIMPIIRPKFYITRAWTISLPDHIHSAQKAGFPNPYIQFGNEPSDTREWNDGVVPPDYVDKWVKEWGAYARIIRGEGGLPGIQCLDAEKELLVLLQTLDKSLFDGAWFAGHPYAWNHDPQHPFGGMTAEQIAKLTEDDIATAVNLFDVSILTHYAFARVFKKVLGFVPPFIQAEGGYPIGTSVDSSYPKISQSLHTKYHLDWFDWFRRGTDSLGKRLPSYYFAACPWLLFDDPMAWVGYAQPTIDAVSALAPFVRSFDEPPAPPPPPPPPPTQTLEKVIQGAASIVPWMAINDQAALYKFAQTHNMGYPQTDEFAVEFGGEKYIAQVFNLGIAYVKSGDWGNVKQVSKP